MARYSRSNKSIYKILFVMVAISLLLLLFKDHVIDSSIINNVGISENKIREMIREEIAVSLKKEPEIVMEAIKQYNMQERAKAMEEANQLVRNNKDRIEDLKQFPYFGARNPKTIITQFFDYQCGYCRKSSNILKELVSKEKDIAVLLIDLPILGESSYKIAQVSAAVFKLKPNIFQNFYFKFMNEQVKSLENVKAIAYSFGINKHDLENMIKSPIIEEYLSENRRLAQDIGVRGTPFIIANSKIYNNALELDAIANFVKGAKK